MHFAGMKVIVNDATFLQPRRKLAPRDWHRRRNYAARVQKKWNARYGADVMPVIPRGKFYEVPMLGALVMNSATLADFRNLVGEPA